MTYFPAEQYHRRHGLHFCVRDGNRCFPAPIFTDNPAARLSPSSECWFVFVVAEDRNALIGQVNRVCQPPSHFLRVGPWSACQVLTVSTASLNAFRRLHVRPINPVVFWGSQSNAHLEVGFPLRCFQRLSLPYLATQRWTERSNWRTRGTSFSILSY